MAAVSHTFNCAIADDAGAQAAGEVLPSHWNATHTLSNVASLSANTFTDAQEITYTGVAYPLSWDLTGDMYGLYGHVSTDPAGSTGGTSKIVNELWAVHAGTGTYTNKWTNTEILQSISQSTTPYFYGIENSSYVGTATTAATISALACNITAGVVMQGTGSSAVGVSNYIASGANVANGNGAVGTVNCYDVLNSTVGGGSITTQIGYHCPALSGATNNYACWFGTASYHFDGLTASTFVYADASKNLISKTATQATALLDAMVGDTGSGGTKGLVPAPAIGDASKFLKGDGTWAAPAGSGTVTHTGGALTAGSLVIGAGADDVAVTTTGTGIVTALGVNVGSAGAPVINGGVLGTPSSGTLTNCTIPVGGVSGLGANVGTFLATPSSANLAAAVTDEQGSGALVFATSPTLTTPTIGVATATSVNKVAITAPATSATLTVADGKTLTASNTVTLTGTDGVSANVTNLKLRQITMFIGDGVNAISANAVSFAIPSAFAGAITAYTIAVDAGTCTIKTWKKATGTAIPTVADVISTSGVAISSGTLVRSTTVTDFTSTAVAANDVFIIQATAVATAKYISFTLEITST